MINTIKYEMADFGVQLQIQFNFVGPCEDKHDSCAAAANFCDSIADIRNDCPKTCGDCTD